MKRIILSKGNNKRITQEPIKSKTLNTIDLTIVKLLKSLK